MSLARLYHRTPKDSINFPFYHTFFFLQAGEGFFYPILDNIFKSIIIYKNFLKSKDF